MDPNMETGMTHPLPITRPGQLLGIFVAILLFHLPAFPAGADDPSPDDTHESAAPPPVFQPGEIQHGFSEFERLPDFEEPAPYKEYSDSTDVPASDQKPGGMFLRMDFAKGVDEEEGMRRGHVYFPIHPTDSFPSSVSSVYLVFTVHKHLTSYHVIGRLFYETENGASHSQWIDEDIVDLATEDESGYLKFFPPKGSWPPGRYRVDIYVGFEANPANKMGAMRFTVHPSPEEPDS
jgi:hypothetical protein